MTDTMQLSTAIQEKDTRLLEWAERIIQQRQYETLNMLAPKPLDSISEAIDPSSVTCLFQVTELVFRREEGSLEPFTTVLNALHASGASCLMLLQCQNGRSELYLGAVNKQRYDNIFYMNTIRDILRSGIEGNLPGTELKEIVSRRDIERKLGQCLDNGFDSQCITAVSCVAGDPPANGKSVPGIENLLEAVGQQNFTLMVLADPINRDQMRVIRRGYEELGTQLSTSSEMSVSLQSGRNTSLSENYSQSVTKTVSDSISLTQSHTSGTGWSKGSSRSDTDSSASTKLAKGAAVAAGILTGGSNAFFAMNAVSTLLVNPAQNGTNDSVSGNASDTLGKQKSTSTSDATGTTRGSSSTEGRSEGVSIQTTTRDHHAQEMLERVQWYLKWLNRCENYGMFNCCAYVLSSNAGVNLMVASQYQALMQGGGDMSQPVTLNTWTRANGVEEVKKSLLHMMHPVLQSKDISDGLTPAMLLSSKELSRQMALPQHSIVGLSVMEYASFGREVVRKTPLRSGRVLRVGAISHMGKAMPRHPVLLDMQSMAAHTFVAGTNGSGKSNTVFRILEELMNASIPFMVIEPAKGEYKNVFGREANVKVYGTNRRKTELLRLNPFWFNEDVDVLEHIDKLIDVFNASWPMYAAMPAVLKASIEGAYRACGWDLKNSVCKGKARVFPTVQDVLAEFNTKMDSTAFSQEVKGNYVGALSTRLESLCNGIYGEIFGGRNLSDQELFDSNVVVDLSRVGAAETKSMIMGMLVIRLQEYRMSSEAMNLPLKHVTVLEEAHHLLRRTSSAQSEEGSNMLGKSVEMISNAIAEMRSYGEGFVIVDQSPGLMDMSVMRNTNTKMILRLPESGDRDMVGNTMGLKPEQIYELSRLKTGVCAIYQKDWLEAVLCQVDRANHEERLYVCPASRDEELSWREEIVRGLLEERQETEPLLELVLKCGISGREKQALIRELTAKVPDAQARRRLVCSLAGAELTLPRPVTGSSVKAWYAALQDDEEEAERWGNLLPKVLQARILYLAEEDKAWQKVRDLLPGEYSAQGDALRASRGRAFRRICPLYCKAAPLTEQVAAVLEEDFRLLSQSDAADQTLAKLLRISLDEDKVRRNGELAPYTAAVWEPMGGQAAWERLYPLLEEDQYENWDREARALLRQWVLTDRGTETSLLSLFLQRKGALPVVKKNFSPWFRYAVKQKDAEA